MVSSRLVSLATRSGHWFLWLLDVALRLFAFRFRSFAAVGDAARSIFRRNDSWIRSTSEPLVALSVASPVASVFKAFAKLSPRLSYVSRKDDSTKRRRLWILRVID